MVGLYVCMYCVFSLLPTCAYLCLWCFVACVSLCLTVETIDLLLLMLLLLFASLLTKPGIR